MKLQIVRGGCSEAPTEVRTATFSGDVWAAPIAAGREGVQMTTVTFAPGARTYWHTHTEGQILIVVSGTGQVRERSTAGGEIRAGDVVFVPPAVEHWHGAGPESVMVHLAVSLGTTNWLNEVSDSDYRAGCLDDSPPLGQI